jgi:two-component system OmpR family sensor kinase
VTLRRRLTISLLALIAFVCLVVGVVSAVSLHGFLLNRLDSQLAAATSRSVGAIERPALPGAGHGAPNPAGFIRIGGQAEGTLGAAVQNGVISQAVVLGSNGEVRALTGPQTNLLGRATGKDPHTIDLGGSLGEYRVAFDTSPSGQGIVVGLPLGDVNAIVARQVLITLLVTALGLLVAGLLGALMIRFALRPLDRVAAIATRVTELQLDRGDVSLAERIPVEDTNPRTEVGRVGAALNRMLGHVASALAARRDNENSVRKFVADASHELRTPLASIRGYAELINRGRYELPTEVIAPLERIESEALRMTSLVEDMLLLARLDSLPEGSSEATDLTALAIGAVSDAHASFPSHRWDLVLPDAPVVVPGDGRQLHQVLSNLLRNASIHTPAGTRVAIALGTRDQDAVLTVTDDGPGIDPRLLPSLFERFVRGDSSRFRAPESTSTGLGLAIVHAVVQAHRGSISVTSKPGQTVFCVVLPMAAEPSIPLAVAKSEGA